MSQVKVLGLNSLVFFCFLTLAGCVGGGAVYLVLPSLPLGTWRLSVTPPIKIARLLVYRYPDIFVQGVDGTIYACDTNRNYCVQDQAIPERDPPRICGEPNSLTPFAPGKVIDALAIRDCGPDGYVDVHFVVVDAGSIWEWSHGWYALGSNVFLAAYGSVGALAGAIVSVISLRIRRHRLPPEAGIS